MANVENLADQAQQQAGAVAKAARGIVVEQIDRRTTDIGGAIGEHVQNLRQIGDTLRGQGQSTTARYVDMAAEKLGSVSTYLTQTDGDRIIHDIENVARKQAMLTAAVGIVAGFAAARVLRASASARYRTYSGTNSAGSRSHSSRHSELSEDQDGSFVR